MKGLVTVFCQWFVVMLEGCNVGRLECWKVVMLEGCKVEMLEG